ncbi:hypothetical protein HFC64_16375 [Saccharolobus solfataricus]|uniref:Uncharacterized protein n=1 Tax=Saccharolobus solfataricus TaxID=2287 RepID=A0A7S9IL52_SACSO|nr:hypothetical protein [Saccharolobus solfataricus]QPG51186.1 hypothetical protein HFC64_16375 [Saccharolobus solfataricus]
MGGLIQQYLTFYNTSKIMLYNPVDNITIIIPAPYNQISIIPCQFSIPTYYPLVTYLKKTNNTFPS